ncbi:ninja-family protein AFP3-like [Solanum stenotomum]|uniref:ninja-family protein AFP3-like n=1 Tax=Solanum stenotomum TaxID=172797 RepID=UPI0020D0BBFC|nr:ninja-family protein AFP3-like [Solanum stenotomum]
MEKAKENMGTSNVENENVELNGGSQGSVASSVTEVEIQQPPIQGNYIAKMKIKNFKLNHMTFVSTRGEGPKGKKTEGLLYSCKKKDEVEIVCLCHGDLLNAAEFVEHTGGGYVEHPLNHIFIDGKQIK